MAQPPALPTAIVVPVHNRREVTLRCLTALRALGTFAWASVIVVDDGSTDGTRQEIESQFPEVTILAGDGNLWWGGSILRGMTHAFERGAGLIFWLNDDCTPHPGTLELLACRAAERQGIAVGQAFTPSGGRYGAFRYARAGLQPVFAPAGTVLPCDAFGGNCVCFPRALVEQVGMPDARHFPHVYADADYGLRARSLGWPVEVLGDAICDNDDNFNPITNSWLLSPTPWRKILTSFFSRKSYLYVPAYFSYRWRHWGMVGLALFVPPYVKFCLYGLVRLLVPRRWLQAWFGARSAAWQRETFKQA